VLAYIFPEFDSFPTKIARNPKMICIVCRSRRDYFRAEELVDVSARQGRETVGENFYDEASILTLGAKLANLCGRV
jgi:hypothetical protein